MGHGEWGIGDGAIQCQEFGLSCGTLRERLRSVERFAMQGFDFNLKSKI